MDARASILHVTNGDPAAGSILRTGIGGQVVPWRDVHEGPVPDGLSDAELAELRARFIGEQGWEDEALARARIQWRDATLAEAPRHDEVVLWFEHDLYDQLQLIEVLERLTRVGGGRARVSLVVVDDYLGPMDPARLRDLFARRAPASASHFDVAREAWAAFRASAPTAIVRLLERDTSALPFLAGALRRHHQQFPSVRNGLSRSEAQIVETLADGAQTLKEAFVASNHGREERVFLGDGTWAWYLAGLSRGPEPLVLFEGGVPIRRPTAKDAADFWARRAVVTQTGRAVLEGRGDWVRIAGIDRWLGGVHLKGHGPVWRWNEGAGRLEER